MLLEPGHRLGRYQILAILGVGGMGEVYRARDQRLGREVAVKLLRERVAADPERLARFEREARVLASLNHPNIATLYGIETEGDTSFLVMELVPGRTLAERIAEGPIPPEEAVPLLIQIVDGLDAAHRQGVVHRDLKPLNIKASDDGRVKILDFGLAKATIGDGAVDGEEAPTLAAQTALGTVMGTAGYMSPEQARGQVVDRQADIWSFGCVLFEMLCGEPAFAAATAADTLVAVLGGDPNWSLLPATTPPPIRRLLAQCLEKDRHRRPRELRDVRGALEQIQRSGVSRGQGPGPVAAAGSFGTAPHNLPAPRTSFVGRREACQELAAALAETRLLTLTGVGGSGKTRLALEVARTLTATFPQGVRLVELASAMEDQVAAAVAAGLGVPGFDGGGAAPGRGGDVEGQICRHLSESRALLVLDNCEHVRLAVAGLVDRLLDACPGLVVLATSREPLGVAGEVIRPVPPLEVPEGGAQGDALRCDGVRLFVERAAASRPGFRLSSQNVEAVLRICRRLDGIPLALELAAARVRHLAPGQIAERLEQSFDLLADHASLADDRHRTLVAAMDWSYGLLSGAEQRMLRSLSVFAGGFGLEAAEGVCATAELEGEDLLGLLGSLVDRSLVVADDTGHEVRYHLLETVRQYAADALEAAGEAELLRDRHRDWFASWVRGRGLDTLLGRAQTRLGAPVPAVWEWVQNRGTAEVELANLTAAIDWSLRRRHAEAAMALAGWSFFRFRNSGRWEEGTLRLDRALAMAGDETSEARTIATFARGASFQWEGRMGEAFDLMERSLGELPAVGLDVLAPAALVMMGVSAQASGRGAPVELFERAIEAARARGDRLAGGMATYQLGAFLLARGEPERAAGLLEEAARAVSGALIEPDVCASRTLAAVIAGDEAAMRWWGERTVTALAAAIDRTDDQLPLTAIALVSAAAGDGAKARATLDSYLVRRGSRLVPLENGDLLVVFAGVATLLDQDERASRLLAAARQAMAANHGSWRRPETGALYVAFRRRIQERLDADTVARARVEGGAMSVEEALEYALAGADGAEPGA